METSFLSDIVVLFGLSIVVLLICHKIKIPPIIGFQLTGVLCGPTALGLVQNVEAVELLADVGVVLLLFTIGMEMSGEEFARLRKSILVGGTFQVLLTVACSMLIILACGLTWQEGILFGCLAALSSTAIVLSRLQQKAQSESPHGRLILAVMIFQDIAVVPMMLVIPFLAGQGEGNFVSLFFSALRTVAILGGGWVLARHVVPWIVRQVLSTRSKELLLMTVLGLCFAIALGTAWLGLSLALGAFLAGLLLSGSEYSLNALEGVLPFKEVFTSLFFISVGMLLDVHFFFANIGIILCFAAALVILKSLFALPAMMAVGYPLRTCILAALSLAQIGEFAFVLARSAMGAGLLDNNGYQMFLAASIITMLITPTIMDRAPTVASMVCRRLGVRGAEEISEEDSGLRDHLIIVGFGVGGQHLARTAREAGIPYVILEMNSETVARYRDREPIYIGDATLVKVLEHYGVCRARVLTIVISDPSAVRAITANARRLNPKLHIVARTRFLSEVKELQNLGASDVVSEDFETSIEIFTRVLGHYLVPQQTIEHFAGMIRKEHYAAARSAHVSGSNLAVLSEDILAGLEVSALKVESGASLAGCSLAQTRLRQKFGVTVVGLRRGGQIIPSPDGAVVLEANDTAYLFAAPEAITRVVPLFRGERSADGMDD